MYKAYKYRIYPDTEQKNILAQYFGATRRVWNYYLEYCNKYYEEHKKIPSYFDMSKNLTQLKKTPEFSWLKNYYAQSLETPLKNLSEAFKRFFKELKKRNYRVKKDQFKPNFKSLKDFKQSCTFRSGVKPNFENENTKFPKQIGNIYTKFHRKFKGKIAYATISSDNLGRYFCSFCVKIVEELPTPSAEGKAVALDMGLIDFCVTSDGEKIPNPRHLDKHEKRLKKYQKDFSRAVKGSKNQEKARIKLAKKHKKIMNVRENFNHRLSRKIVDDNQVIICENLNISAMMKNHKLAKSIQQVGWGQFQTMLKYKAEHEGKVYLEVNRFFPSSKTCSNCGHKVDSLPLNVREWTCPECNSTHDRDLNATYNLLNEGLRLISMSCVTQESASCLNVRPMNTEGLFDGKGNSLEKNNPSNPTKLIVDVAQT